MTRQVVPMMGLESDFGYEHIPGIPSTNYGFGADAAPAPQIVIQTPASTPAKVKLADTALKAIGFSAIIAAALYGFKKAEKNHTFDKFKSFHF